MGYKMSTFMNDVTEQYISRSDISTWNLRATSDWVDSRVLKIGSILFVLALLREGELQEYCLSIGWDISKDLNINNARVRIRKAQEAE